MRQVRRGTAPGSREFPIPMEGRNLESAEFDSSSNLCRIAWSDGTEDTLSIPGVTEDGFVAKINRKKEQVILKWMVKEEDEVRTVETPQSNGHCASIGSTAPPLTVNEKQHDNIPPLAQEEQDEVPQPRLEASKPGDDGIKGTPSGLPKGCTEDDGPPPLEASKPRDDSIKGGGIPEAIKGTPSGVPHKPAPAEDDGPPPLEDAHGIKHTGESGGKAKDKTGAAPLEHARNDEGPPPLEKCETGLHHSNRTTKAPRPPHPNVEDKTTGREEEGEKEEEFHIPEDCENPAQEEMFQRLQRQMERRKREAKEKEAKVAAKVDKSSFGLKKGFFGGKEKNNDNHAASVKKEERKSNVVEVVPKKPTENPLRLKEVQEVLDYTKKDTSWMDKNLMNAMMMKPNLVKGLSDPRIMEAMELMRTNPEGAKVKYKDDKEVMDFIYEFSGLMGTHFDKLARDEGKNSNNVQIPGTQKDAKVDITPVKQQATKTQNSTANSEPVQPAMYVSDEIKALLSDPDIQELFNILRSNKMDVREYLQHKPHMMPKIQELLKHKLLDVQS